MRKWLLTPLLCITVGCGKKTEEPIKTEDESVAPTPKKTDKKKVTQSKPKPKPKPPTPKEQKKDELIVIQLKPVAVPEAFLKSYFRAGTSCGTIGFSSKEMTRDGKLNGTRAQHRYLAKRTSAEDPRRFIRIDFNDNKKFTDETEIEVPKVGEFGFRTASVNGRDMELGIACRKWGTGWQEIFIRRTKWLQGTYTIKGTTRLIAFVDTTLDRLDFNGRDHVFVDLDNDGKINMGKYKVEGEKNLTKALQLPEGLYTTSFDSSTLKMTLSPAPFGTVEISSELPAEETTYSMTMGPKSQKGLYKFNEPTFTVSPGCYEVSFFQIAHTSDAGEFILNLRVPKITVKNKETVKLMMGKPKSLEVHLYREMNSLFIASLVGFDKGHTGFEKSLKIYHKPNHLYPDAVVYVNDKLHTKRSMKEAWVYPWKSREYVFNIPYDRLKAKKGDKIHVKLSWDTKLFGVLKGEKTYTWK